MVAEEQPIGVRRRANRLWIPVAYVATVLAVDTLAAQHAVFLLPWGWFEWNLYDVAHLFEGWGWIEPETAIGLRQSVWARFDCFKFLFWFVVPFAFCLSNMDGAWFGLKRLKKWDYALLGGGVLLGILVLFVIPLLPGLRDYYPSLREMPAEQKRLVVLAYLVWTASWLPGWEFLHRYVLVKALGDRMGGMGWLLIPAFEGLYHLPKSPWECAGMVVFSFLASYYAKRKESMVVPFLVHLAIEMALPVFMVAV